MKIWALLSVFIAVNGFAKESMTLTLASQVDNGHQYYHELLYEALTRDGYDVNIIVPSDHIPQKRVVKMVESDQLSLTWLLATPERDQSYASVDVPLTNGLIGKRLLLIPSDLQEKFDSIDSLDALRESNLVAGLGISWFDVDVWQFNALPVFQADGEWRSLYWKLSASGPINYFPRGLNEIGLEAAQNPHLSIEKRLMLVYNRDFKFYLSPQMAHYKPKLEHALLRAKQEGLIDQLVDKYWGSSFKQLQPEQRTVIYLELPPSVSQKH
ncbi:hypothetical protein FCU94_07360 [Vibrio sp. JPW-9-11-11]|uniref:hypothetical protein n=1 Tax=Vibrio sp. JPW-9-11-11 TaxID=1416532 RepID=UPI0015932E58|nr:hypothetical protein [Vibrio sp. JPW-9-11-11]NVD06729.1 hypothetical protein [Vibrio sp. JPW-9-11-11]